MFSDLLTVRAIRDAILEGKMTAVQAVSAALNRIQDNDENIGAFLETFDDEALARAREIDAMKKRGEELPVLAGVPIAIKDNILYKGHIASAGSKILEEYTATYNATAVDRLLAAGAIIIGRCNMDEFAMGTSTETSAHQKTYNPWDTTRIPGGSSGGSIAAVAAGFVPAALGSETGGSVRQPAAMCGVVGLKPSYGRISRYGLIALGSSLDQIGIAAHTVDDVALILGVIEGRDERDATTIDLDGGVVADLLTPNLQGVRVGVPKEYFIDGLDEEVRKSIMEALEVMKAQGAELIDISLPLTQYALPAYYIIQPAEACSNLGRFDGLRYGTRASGTLDESYLTARGEGFGPEVKRRIILGAFTLSAGYKDAFYKKAQAVRTAIAQEFDEAFKMVDVIACPTSPAVAWKMGEKFSDPLAMYLADIFTVSANLAGLTAISVPCGFSNGLPIGLQLQAKPFDEAKLLSIAAGYQAATDWHARTPLSLASLGSSLES